MTEDLKQVSNEAETVTGVAETGHDGSSEIHGSQGAETLAGQAARVLTPPPAGQTEVVRLAPGERFEIAANPTNVSLVVDGDNLVLGFDLDGDGQADSFLVLEDLVITAGGGNPPVLLVAGEPISTEILIGSALARSGVETGGPGTTLETAAGADAIGGGNSTYSDNLGETLDLLVAQGVIPPVELQFGLIELEDEPIVPEDEVPAPEAPPVTLIHDETRGVQNANDDGVDDEDDVDPPLPPALQTAYDDLCDHEVSLQAMGTIPFGAGETLSLNAVVDGTDSGLDTGGTDSPEDIFLFNYDTNIIHGQTAEGEVIFIVYLDDATGEIWFVQCQPINHFDPTDPDEADTPELLNLLYTITGPGGATVGTIEIQIQDDGPTLADDVVFYGGFVDEADLDTEWSQGTNEDGAEDGPPVTTGGSLAGAVDFGFDGPGGFVLGEDFAELEAQNLSSKGDAITYSVSGDTLTATADDGGADERIVFTLELQADGTWTFTLYDQLDHDPGDGTNTLDIDFSSVIFAEDNDEDAINLPDSVIVTVQDDVPEQVDGAESGIVEEEHLVGGNEDDTGTGDADSDPDFDNTTTVASGSLSSIVNIGADEPATFSLTPDTTTLEALSLSSGGDLLTYGFTADGVLVAAAGAFDPEDSSNWVFTLELQSNGDWEFTLLGKLDHHDVDAADDIEGNLLIDFSALVEVTDFDEDPVSLGERSLTVQIIDDIPIANDDEDDAEVGGAAVSGNVIDGIDSGDNGGAGPDDDNEADSPGADGLGVIRSILHNGVTYTLSFDGNSVDDGTNTSPTDENDLSNFGFVFDPATGKLTLETAEGGTLEIDLAGADIGDYTYTPPDAGPLSGSSEEFVYELEDGDGDGDTATLTINLDDQPTAKNASTLVDEDGLPDGIGDNADGDDDPTDGDPDNDESTSEGSLVYDAGASGLKSLSLDVSNGDPVLISGTLTQVFSGGVGLVWKVISDTEIHAVTDDVSETVIISLELTTVTPTGADYDVKLLEPVDHPVADTEDNILIDIGYTVTDNDDDTASAVLTINVDDDVPVQLDGAEGGAVFENELATPHSTGSDQDGITGDDDNFDGNDDDTVATGDISSLVDFGADGPGGFSLSSDTTDLESQGLTSKGDPISYSVVGDTLTATADGSVSGDAARTIFTLTLSAAGVYVFTLNDQLDHAFALGANELDIDFSSIIVATDNDGDSIILSTESVVITVVDDVPTIGTPDHGVVASTANISVTGDLDLIIGADELAIGSLEGNDGPSDITSGGQPVTYFVDPSDPSILIAHTGGDPEDENSWVFTLEINGDGTYTFNLLQPIDATETVAIGAATAFGAGPTQFQVLSQSDGSEGLAILSSSDGGVNGSTAGWGVANNNFNDGQTIRVDFGEQEEGSPGPGGFAGPMVSGASIMLLKYSDGDQFQYTVYFVDANGVPSGSETVDVTVTGGGGNIDFPVDITAPDGLFLAYIDFTATDVDGGGGKFDLVDVTIISNTGTQDLEFDFDVTDHDGDPASGVIAITVDGSTDVLSGTAENDVIAGDDSGQTIEGLGGDDIIIGGGGDDTLTGGDGADTFVFSLNADESMDQITDFSLAEGDVLSFIDVVDINAPGGIDVDDVIASFVDGGGAGTVDTITLTSGTVIQVTDVDGAFATADDVFNNSLINGA